MDKSAIEKIAELAQPNIIEQNGYAYSDKRLSVIETPKATSLKFKTLDSLAKVLTEEIALFEPTVIVNVSEHNTVRVLSGISRIDRDREIPYVAEAETLSITFDNYIPVESMIIQLKSKFVETPELINLVELLGTIDEENSIKLMDDGFSQSVTVRKGIAMKDNKVVNPRITLTPFRTFVDVQQPSSEFLLRLRDGGYVALFEADGGAWKLDARRNIVDVLKDKLVDLVDDGKIIITE